MTRDRIVVFEDSREDATLLVATIRKTLGRQSNVVVVSFPTSRPSSSNSEKTFEKRILKDLQASGQESVALIVCDRDLSGTPDYRGLSESSVSKVAELLSVPVCLYARGMKGTVVERAQEWRDKQIVMNFSLGFRSLASTIVSVYRGFRVITDLSRKFLSATKPPKTPAQALSRALSRPEIADRLALYGSGNLSNLADVFRAKKNRRAVTLAAQSRRMARLLGLWLYDSILRFPGILVNRVAAASYLGLNEKSFESKLAQKAFSKALYYGPFCELGPFWWRDRLDEIVQRKGATSGYELMKIVHPAGRWGKAVCHVDGVPPAGFYCLFLEKAVSERHSRGNLSWFPAGADLSRLTTSVYEELAPWIGLY